jgi:periplasmic divalent cation tolerance protein
MTDVLVVLVTVPSRDKGEEIAGHLVEEHVAACVNILGPVSSVYRWQGEVCADDEHLLVIKTTRERYPSLEERVRALHSYDVPEVLALPVEAGSAAYLDWVIEEVR